MTNHPFHPLLLGFGGIQLGGIVEEPRRVNANLTRADGLLVHGNLPGNLDLTAVPLAATAFHTRAPSMCRAMLRLWDASRSRVRCSRGTTRPP